MRFQLLAEAKLILDLMHQNGFECYMVGGCVRDLLLGKKPSDYDFATSALPNEILECFSDYKTYNVGIKFGTVCVLINGNKFEITTYRSDGNYLDFRHPNKVNFTRNLQEDLKRRDFTINAIAYNEEKGIVDLFDSICDLKNGIIRCVGNPNERFNEDALRILRALRFSSKFNFTIDEETSKSIIDNVDLLANIANERISVELLGILTGIGVRNILDEYKDVFAFIIPELRPMFDFDQRSPYHCYDLWHHTIETINNISCDSILRMTMLLHDIGKVDTFTLTESGRGHFYGHPEVSFEKAKVILKRLKYSNEFIHTVSLLIKYHDVRFNGNRKLIKKVMSVIGKDNMELLFKVQCSDMLSQSDYKKEEKLFAIKESMIEYQKIIKEEKCFSLKQLEIDGRDLIDIGITDGHTIGQILNTCLDEVINETLENKKEVLIRRAKKLTSE